MPNSPLERLRKRSEFLAVAKTGELGLLLLLLFKFIKATEGSSRYGITASRKVGGAVERNRAKRRLRALLKTCYPPLSPPGIDYVFIARKEVLRRDFSLMGQELVNAIRKLLQKENISIHVLKCILKVLITFYRLGISSWLPPDVGFYLPVPSMLLTPSTVMGLIRAVF